MPPAGVFIAVAILFLHGAASHTSEVLQIVECFTKAVDMPRDFSDEEIFRLFNFQTVTRRSCSWDVWRIFECNYPLMEHLREANNLISASRQQELDFYKAERLEHYENATELQKAAVLVLQNLILEIQEIQTLAAARNESRILRDSCSGIFFDLDELKNQTVKYTDEHRELQIKLDILRLRSHVMWNHLPTFLIVVLICGVVGNGLLLFIFARHPETCKGSNVMLLNLAVSDILFLVCNIALDYPKQLWGFPLGTNTCYFYNFILTFVTGNAVYSMAMLSYRRYVAAADKAGVRSHRILGSVPAMLVTVWLLACLVAIPDTLASAWTENEYSNKTQCYANNTLLNSASDFLFVSFLPFIAITGFYLAANRRLRNVPGVKLGEEKVHVVRRRARLLLVLAFVFAITYLPFYTFWLIMNVLKINADLNITPHRIYFVVYFLFNLNSALNPVALYIGNSALRKYFRKYLSLGLWSK